MKRAPTSRTVLASAVPIGASIVEPFSGVVAPVLDVRRLEDGRVELELGAPVHCRLQRAADAEVREMIRIELPPQESDGPQQWIPAGRKGYRCSKCGENFELRRAHACSGGVIRG